MKNAVIYTFISNQYDRLKTPKATQKLPMVCYANTDTESLCWEIKPIKDLGLDAVRTARYYKLHPHKLFPDKQWSVWVDGSLSITNDLSLLINEVKATQQLLGVYRHAKRDCLYQAALNCIDKNKGDPEAIRKQTATYQSEGFPPNFGLVASGVLVRSHHNPQVIELMGAWWQEISMHSNRDQISFNYVCWKLGFAYHEIKDRIGDGRFFRRNPHQAA